MIRRSFDDQCHVCIHYFPAEGRSVPHVFSSSGGQCHEPHESSTSSLSPCTPPDRLGGSKYCDQRMRAGGSLSEEARGMSARGPSRHFAATPHSRLQAIAFVLSLIARRLDYLHESLLARRYRRNARTATKASTDSATPHLAVKNYRRARRLCCCRTVFARLRRSG